MKFLFSSLLLAGVFFISSAFNSPTPTFDTKNVDITQSKIEWLGKKVTGEHTGTINIKTGKLNWENNMLKGGYIEIDMNTINVTDLEGEYKGKLEGHLKSPDFFSVADYPVAKFTFNEVNPSGVKNIYNINGELTIKGITNKLSFQAEIMGNKAKAKVTVDRSKYDVRYGSNSFFDNLGDKAIYDDFELDVNLVLN